jgi:hypothetical protein
MTAPSNAVGQAGLPPKLEKKPIKFSNLLRKCKVAPELLWSYNFITD